MSFNFKGAKGFSLIELMIVVGIIGILAALAVPQFSKFQARARQTEAKSSLATLFTLQQAYYNDNNTYVALASAAAPYGKNATTTIGCDCSVNTLGFSITPCTTNAASNAGCPRYGYYTSAATSAAFTAVALSGQTAENLVMPGCATADQVTIDQTRALTQVAASNAVVSCP